jgi:hypothetical protein
MPYICFVRRFPRTQLCNFYKVIMKTIATYHREAVPFLGQRDFDRINGRRKGER